jgi:cell shape-determining protein MreD
MSWEVGLVLIVATVAFFPITEYWASQARGEEQRRRRNSIEAIVPLIFWSWVVVLVIAAIGGSLS